MENFVKAVAKSAIQEGCGTAIELEGRRIAIFQVDGKFYAIDNSCGHRGGPLSEGSLDGNVISCPWHGFLFDVTTGYCATNPTIKQISYPVKIEGNDIWVEIPTRT